MRHSLLGVCLGCLAASTSMAQNAEKSNYSKVEVANHLFESVATDTINIPFLPEVSLKVTEFNGEFFFVPVPIPNWGKFERDVIAACEGKSDSASEVAELDVFFFNNGVRQSIADSVSANLRDVHTIPVYGWSIFVQDLDHKLHRIAASHSVSPEFLRSGERLDGNAAIPAYRRNVIEQPCGFLKEIVRKHELSVSFHSVGKSFKKTALTAELLMSGKVDEIFDMDRSENEVQRVTINTSGKNGGWSLNLGGILNTGNTSSNLTTVSDRSNYRMVDRDYLSKRANILVASINTKRICDAEINCDDNSLRDMIVDHILARANDIEMEFKTIDSRQGDLVSNEVRIPAVIEIDELTKATLNTQYDALHKAKFNYGEAEGEKETQNKITIDGIGSFELKGEDWVPTSLQIKLVDVAELNRDVSVSYTDLFLDSVRNISFYAEQMHYERLPDDLLGSGSVESLASEMKGIFEFTNLWAPRLHQMWQSSGVALGLGGCPPGFQKVGILSSGFSHFSDSLIQRGEVNVDKNAGAWQGVGIDTIHYHLCNRIPG